METSFESSADAGNRFVLAAIMLGGVGVIVTLLPHLGFNALLADLEAVRWHRVITRPSLVFALAGVVLLMIRAALWYRYRPVLAPSDDALPTLTVIIPAYNEGRMVMRSIDSVASARYPADRLEIIVVDDGSKDDTWQYMEEAAARHPGLVRTVRFAQNRGKRAALAAGFRQASGVIAVTIDSDSIIEADTLRAMVAPFNNSRVGAVAGRVSVLNRAEGYIPAMLHVRYAMSFDFLRAAQSVYGSVYCCPGALAAYRMSVVREVLDRWLGQRFLGSDCTIGEDRAMTNFILAEKFDVVYQRNAVVHTLAPTSYRGLCKMFLRWDRSYIREEFRLARLLARRPLLPALFIGLDVFTSNVGFVFAYIALFPSLLIIAQAPHLAAYLLLGIGMGASFNALYFLRSERSWRCLYGIAYGYYAAFALAWILPYAALTVRSRGWLTR